MMYETKMEEDTEYQYQRRKDCIVDLLRMFRDQGFTFSYDTGSRITTESFNSATALLYLLPSSCKLPKIVPDGEGGVIMAWEAGDKTVILTIENWTLHLVISTATRIYDYVEDILFNGEVS